MIPEAQEQAQHILQFYHEVRFTTSGACQNFVESLDIHQYSYIIQVALSETYKLSQKDKDLRYGTPEYHDNLTRVMSDISIIQDLCKRNPVSSGEDIQAILRMLCNHIAAEQLISYRTSMLHDIASTLGSYLKRPEILAVCRDQLMSFYELAPIWGNYDPLRESYRLRLLIGDLLFDGNAPGLVSLLDRYAQGSDLALTEQVQQMLAVYHQEMGTFRPASDHPALEIIRHSASNLLKVCLLREAIHVLGTTQWSNTYAWFNNSSGYQNESLVNAILTEALPYTIEDIQGILRSSNAFFSHNKQTGHIDNTYIFFFNLLDVCFPYVIQPEGLIRCRSEIELLYYYVSQEMTWYEPHDRVNSTRLWLRKLLFPESSGPFLDLLQSSDKEIALGTDTEAQNVLAALHEDLGHGYPNKEHPLIVQLKAKLIPQSSVRIIRLTMQEISEMLEIYARDRDNCRYQHICACQNVRLIDALLRKSLPFMPDDIYAMLNTNLLECINIGMPIEFLLKAFTLSLEQADLLERCRPALEAFKASLLPETYWRGSAELRRYRLLVDRLLAAPQQQFRSPLLPDAWATPILDELAALPDVQRACWLNMLYHCANAKGNALGNIWLEQARSLIEAIEVDVFTRTLHRWISFFSDKKGERMDTANSDILRGLIWLCTGSIERPLATILADTAIEGYRKLSGLGPRAPKVAGAAVDTLESMPGMYAISQLERVRLHVKQPSYQEKIGQALDAVAQRENMSRSDLEELTVPTFDLKDGQLVLPFGTYTAQLTVDGRTVQVDWSDANGTQYKNVPAEVKRTYKNELKDLKRLSGDIEHMLSTQRDCVEHLLLLDRHWSLEAWEERYLHHPLLSLLSRRLIWQLCRGDQVSQGIWSAGRLVDVNNRPLELVADTDVSLWHPMMGSTQEAQRWRLWLEEHLVTQPFKQAHREIYPLTVAERETSDHSMRFAGQIIAQYQFNALARAHNWKFSLQSNFSGAYSDDPARLELPDRGMSAEFVVHGYTGDQEIYQYLTTAQVYFSSSDPTQARRGNSRQFIPLEQIQPIIFSEVMRDLDLFVSVANAGADPNGYNQTGSLEDYWQRYNQSELSLSAEERKNVLERLVPRLVIAERCSFEGRFLTVRGDLHTYTIHLGSGNIMLKPDNQYLCIVMNNRAQENSDNQYYLPFEGDSILSLILSKAFLLANDKQIKDPSILSQLRR